VRGWRFGDTRIYFQGLRIFLAFLGGSSVGAEAAMAKSSSFLPPLIAAELSRKGLVGQDFPVADAAIQALRHEHAEFGCGHVASCCLGA
jgi:hypothetical protein